MKTVGQTIFAFLEDYLKAQKGLRPGSVRSYRDTLKLFLAYVASSRRRPITRLVLPDLSAQRVLDFLNMMEATRGNRVSTRNQRLAALHTFYRYLALQNPEMLAEAQRVDAIPVKRSTPPQTDYLEHEEIEKLADFVPRHIIGKLQQLAFVKSATWVRDGLMDGVEGEVLECAAILHDCLLGRVGTCGMVGAGRPEPSALVGENSLAGLRQCGFRVGFGLDLLRCDGRCLDGGKNQG